MSKDKVLLRVKRFLQEDNECAIAAASSVANYYDKSIDYINSRKLLPFNLRRNGLFSSQQARLFNQMGFMNVNIVTADVEVIDFTWSNLSKKSMIKKLNKLQKYYNRTKYKNGNLNEVVGDLHDWLSNPDYNNNLIIDNDFAKYIRKNLDKGNPVCASVVATSLFKMKKWPLKKDSDIKGEKAHHALVIRGYDQTGVYIVDSDHGFADLSLKKYLNGFYKISWDKFLPNIADGDLIFIE